MKKLLIAMTAGAIVAGGAIAQEVVTSVNIVGYKKHTFEGGKFYLVSTQFEDIDGNALHPENVIGDQLPFGSQVFAWDAFKDGGPGYDISTRVSAGFTVGWDNPNVTLNGTQGFWVAPSGTGTHEVAFLGEVPMATAVTNVLAPTFTMTAYPYTADIAFSNTAMYANSQFGDQIFVWDGETQGYTISTKVSAGFTVGWDNGGENLMLTQGTALWYSSIATQSVQIVDNRPYNP